LYGVGVTSWNEWNEGTAIEPALYGYQGGRTDRCHYSDFGTVGSYGYLYKTQRYAARFATMPLPESYASRSSVTETLGPQYHDDGLYQIDVSDGEAKNTTIAGRPATSPIAISSPVRYLYFAVENQFAWQRPAGSNYTLTVTLLDQGTGQIKLHYDAQTGLTTSPTSYTLTNTGTWRTLTFQLPNAYLGGRLNRATDLRLVLPPQDTWINNVTLTKN
jgi:hypothetical protein